MGGDPAMDKPRSGGQEKARGRTNEVHTPGPLGHAVFSRTSQRPSVRLYLRGEPTDDHRNSQVPLRLGDDHAQGRGSGDAGDSQATNTTRSNVCHWRLEWRFTYQFYRDLRHQGRSMGESRGGGPYRTSGLSWHSCGRLQNLRHRGLRRDGLFQLVQVTKVTIAYRVDRN